MPDDWREKIKAHEQPFKDYQTNVRHFMVTYPIEAAIMWYEYVAWLLEQEAKHEPAIQEVGDSPDD